MHTRMHVHILTPHTHTHTHSTLYCAKGNYEFGVARIMKSLEPYNKKVHVHIYIDFIPIKSYIQLGTDTWFYAKRCFCSLIVNMVRL